MNIKFTKNIIFFSVLILVLNGCTANKKLGTFKHNTPLIKENVKELGQKEVQKTVEMGPTPLEGDFKKLQKRKKISSIRQKNYLLIPDESFLLKQSVSFKFQNLDYKEAMGLMARIGEVNILVGEEVAGAISAELVDVPWDKAFNALLDMKNFAADIDVASNIIRVHSPSTLTAQESYKSARAAAVKKKVELEDSVEPIVSEIFRLYYIAPAEAKATISELFSSSATGETYSPIQVTEEKTTRSIIVRGKEKDLDVVDKVIREIDIRTKQVLIEAFIVQATSDFQKALGARIGAMTEKGTSGEKGSEIISGTVGGASTTAGGIALGAAAGTVTKNTILGATSGIGIIKTFGTAALKLELEALEGLQLSKILSSPSVFTLNNMEARITQGTQIAYQTTSDGTTTTEFKEAALSLVVTPSIIGDGNVLLDIKVNKDAPVPVEGSDEPGIYTNEIVTKLLVSDGDIVVIGGIKENTTSDNRTKTPGLGNIPVVGNLFKSKTKGDKLTELLIFISSRVID